MAGLDNFNAADHKNEGFAPIPKGEYPMVMTESAMTNNSKRTGSYLKTKFQIVAGPFQNRIVFKNFNWTTTSQEEGSKKAVQIGKGQFSAFCRAAGILTPKDSAQLHNIPVIGCVKIKKGDDSHDDGNDITDFKSVGGVTAPATGQPAPVLAGAPAGKPWG